MPRQLVVRHLGQILVQLFDHHLGRRLLIECLGSAITPGGATSTSSSKFPSAAARPRPKDTCRLRQGEILLEIAHISGSGVAHEPATMSETLPWNLPLPRLLAELGSTLEGLSAREVERRLAKYGPNDALLHRRRPLWRQILDRFANPLILILLFASGLSAWTGEVTSFALIVGIILLSVVLDVVQQARAENTVDALRRSVGLKAEVLRDGKVVEVAVDRLVPGDVVELRAGDIVPGDCRLLVARDLYVNQALLTGEAYPAEKHAVDLATPVEQPGQAGNFLCMGTSVISGMATGLIVRTGRADRAWRPCPWTGHGAATRCVRARHPPVRIPDVAADRVPGAVRHGHQCGVPPALARIAACSRSPLLSASRPSFCRWWSP